MPNALKKIKDSILDILFPINCFFCKQEGEWVCKKCFERIPLKSEQTCPVCERRPTPDGKVCFACRHKTKLDALLTASFYKDYGLAELIHNFKYRFIVDLHIPLGKLLIKSLLASQLPLPELIIPVPLHKRRLRQRGFNQAELLAYYISKNLVPGLEIPVVNNLLYRQKYTQPQMRLKNYFQRKRNVKDIFRICSAKSISGNKSASPEYYEIKNKTVLLVDDIATTGSTLFECAKTLKQARAKSVFALVIARQEMKNKS